MDRKVEQIPFHELRIEPLENPPCGMERVCGFVLNIDRTFDTQIAIGMTLDLSIDPTVSEFVQTWAVRQHVPMRVTSRQTSFSLPSSPYSFFFALESLLHYRTHASLPTACIPACRLPVFYVPLSALNVVRGLRARPLESSAPFSRLLCDIAWAEPSRSPAVPRRRPAMLGR